MPASGPSNRQIPPRALELFVSIHFYPQNPDAEWEVGHIDYAGTSPGVKIISNPLERFLIKNYFEYHREEDIVQIAPQLWQELRYYEMMDVSYYKAQRSRSLTITVVTPKEGK